MADLLQDRTNNYPRCPYSRSLVARIKGALLAGMRPKQLAYQTGIPLETIKHWNLGSARADVAPDSTVKADIRRAILEGLPGVA